MCCSHWLGSSSVCYTQYPTKLKREPRPENVVVSLHYCWARFEISTQARVTDKEQTGQFQVCLSCQITSRIIDWVAVMRKRRLLIADCADTADCPDCADCRVQAVQTSRRWTAACSDYRLCRPYRLSKLDYSDGRLRSLCRPQTVQTVQTTDNEDCWFFRLRRLSRLETMKTVDCFDCKDYADFCRMCRPCKLCVFFTKA